MITLTTYKFENIDNWDEFIHNLFTGLKHYEKKNKSFKFKISYRADSIELKIVDLGYHAN